MLANYDTLSSVIFEGAQFTERIGPLRSLYSGEPFTTSTPEIAAALKDVSIPTLLLSLVHITGDPRFIRDFKQMGIFLNEVQGFMSEEDKARARAEALSVITQVASFKLTGKRVFKMAPIHHHFEKLGW